MKCHIEIVDMQLVHSLAMTKAAILFSVNQISFEGYMLPSVL